MKEKLVSLRSCVVGDVVSRDVLDLKSGVILCNKGYEFTEEGKEWLSKFDCSDIYVEDNPWNKVWNLSNEVVETYQQNKGKLNDLLESLRFSKAIDVEAITEIQKELYKQNVMQNSTIMGCVNIIKRMDEYTHAHCMNVGLLAVLIGRWLKLSEETVEDLFLAGMLHDVGKYKIENAIINKKGKLTEQEYVIVKKHAIKGYDLIKNVPEISDNVKQGVLGHHERIDGSGYPRGLKDTEIDLFAKIIAVADIYDAMISERCYKKRQTPFEVMESMLNEGINKLDTKILLVFLKSIADYYIGTYVKLSTGEVAEVVFIHPHCVYRPIVKVANTYIDLDTQREISIIDIV